MTSNRRGVHANAKTPVEAALGRLGPEAKTALLSGIHTWSLPANSAVGQKS